MKREVKRELNRKIKREESESNSSWKKRNRLEN